MAAGPIIYRDDGTVYTPAPWPPRRTAAQNLFAAVQRAEPANSYQALAVRQNILRARKIENLKQQLGPDAWKRLSHDEKLSYLHL